MLKMARTSGRTPVAVERATASPEGREVPHLREDPEYAAAAAQLEKIRADRKDLLSRIEAIYSAVARDRSLTDQAMAYLRGEAFDNPDGIGKLELAKMHERLAILDEAESLQVAALRDARNRASLRVVGELLSSYQEIVARMAKHAVDLGKAAEEEVAFRDRLIAAGYAGVHLLIPANFPAMQLSVSGSDVNRWLDETETNHGIRIEVKRAAPGVFGFRDPYDRKDSL